MPLPDAPPIRPRRWRQWPRQPRAKPPRGGERLKRIGSEARQELEPLLDARVFLELWVKVRSGWADDEQHLRSYGYE